ncbi:MAG: hypothetical protein P8L34_04690 [Arenicellales bacterium]|nr:hypothetical protein [Arenicellales bacterium]
MISAIAKILTLFALLSICFYSIRPWLRGVSFYSCFGASVIAIALGAMLGGLFYVLLIIVGISSAWLALICLLFLAVIGQTLPSSRSHWAKDQYSRCLRLPATIILFLSFGGLILVTCIKMGLGDFPPFFVNYDTPLRLSHAFAMLHTEVYPPERLQISGTFRAYHYGGPATVAFISKVTGISPHKAMFWIVNPLFLLAGFFSILSLLGKATENKIYFIVAFVLFLPAVFLGRELFALIGSDSALSTLVFNFIGGTTPGTYNSEPFARGVPDVAALSGRFLLFFAVLLLTATFRTPIYAIVFLVSILIVFTKMDMAPATFIILGIALLRGGIYSSTKLSIIFFVILLVSPLVYMNIFGYFANPSPTQIMAIRSAADFFSYFNWKSNGSLREQIVVVCLFAPTAWLLLTGSKSIQRIDSFLIGVTACLLAGLWVLVALVDIPNNGDQLAGPGWIGIPLTAVALLYAIKGQRNHLPLIVFFPFVVIGFQGQWMKFNHMSVAFVLPEHVNEYANNSLIGDALRHIPVNADDWTFQIYVNKHPDLLAAYNHSSDNLLKADWGKDHFDRYGKKEGRQMVTQELRPQVVTNHFGYGSDLRYGGWPDTQMQITSLFGHQAYGVDLRSDPGPRGFNREGERRIGAQRTYYLTREFAISNPEFVANTKKIARQRRWTHFLLRKDLDDGLPPIDPNVIPLQKLYENERYAVFEF